MTVCRRRRGSSSSLLGVGASGPASWQWVERIRLSVVLAAYTPPEARRPGVGAGQPAPSLHLALRLQPGHHALHTYTHTNTHTLLQMRGKARRH